MRGLYTPASARVMTGDLISEVDCLQITDLIWLVRISGSKMLLVVDYCRIRFQVFVYISIQYFVVQTCRLGRVVLKRRRYKKQHSYQCFLLTLEKG